MAKKKQAATSTTDMLIAVVLDKSGSMYTVQDATISGFNEFKADQERQGKELGGKTLFSLTLFDTHFETRHVGLPIADVPDLDRTTYAPGGNTALYDAIGASVRAVEGMKDLPAKVLFVIQTDGQENSSKEWTREKVFALISEKRAAGWAFLFLGADQDAYAAGGAIGIAAGSTVSYASSDTQQTFTLSSGSATAYRTGTRSADHLAAPVAPKTAK
jgi:hypothetical protein